MEGVKT